MRDGRAPLCEPEAVRCIASDLTINARSDLTGTRRWEPNGAVEVGVATRRRTAVSAALVSRVPI